MLVVEQGGSIRPTYITSIILSLLCSTGNSVSYQELVCKVKGGDFIWHKGMQMGACSVMFVVWYRNKEVVEW